MPYQVTLRHRSSVFENQYRLQVEVTAATGLSTAIFLFQQIPNWHGNASEAQPLGVCSPADLVNHPVDTPTPGAQWPLFRRAVIDVLVDSTVAVTDLLAAIEAAVIRLCQALEQLEDLSAWQTLTIG